MDLGGTRKLLEDALQMHMLHFGFTITEDVVYLISTASCLFLVGYKMNLLYKMKKVRLKLILQLNCMT